MSRLYYGPVVEFPSQSLGMSNYHLTPADEPQALTSKR